jgi:hypothetical protein
MRFMAAMYPVGVKFQACSGARQVERRLTRKLFLNVVVPQVSRSHGSDAVIFNVHGSFNSLRLVPLRERQARSPKEKSRTGHVRRVFPIIGKLYGALVLIPLVLIPLVEAGGVAGGVDSF